MANNKYQGPVIVAVLVVLVAIFYLFVIKEKTSQQSMQDALAKHNHENAVIYAAELLETQPTNQEAKKVIRESGQILFFLQAGRSALSELGPVAEGDSASPAKLYIGLKKSQDYAAKAKALDPQFKRAMAFEKALDEAEIKLVAAIAKNIVGDGKDAVTEAAANFEKASKIVDSAASSSYFAAYLSVQSAWGSFGPSVEKAKKEIDPILKELDNMGQLVSDYAGGNTQEYVKPILTYINAVGDTVNTFIMPHGSYDDFIDSADGALGDYQKVERTFKLAMPKSMLSGDNYSDLAKKIGNFKIFQDNSTEKIILANKSLYQLEE